ncbi:Mitochondrial import inner membrane translocase subunit tim54 [Ophiocordyceps camponoti-floridani]|uniref:Mitochondrial import inner membrane translocase subunit TIM54 n=1 Tax=Ophiocordyceps camponoti-floridani TaxID=2030778 RepID=A0A8H4Q4A5_9HYPO|nr:Mitochondrial import inner membrane translocase subunit tim54 [Ophiocordyceps camponoti-floridani]
MADAGPDPKSALKPPPPPSRNPALRMLGLPRLPSKLPSRNWLIFWAVTGSLASAIIYDRRQKKRATARWRRAVEPLSRQPISGASQLPRKLTVYLEAPPGDGLRAAQDHFIEYVKPVLAASGLDWEFVQGRQQGDVRAAVAARVRRERMPLEGRGDEVLETEEGMIEALRARIRVPRYEGIQGDIILGRHTWKDHDARLRTQRIPPATALPFPHRLGFRHTLVRLSRFLNRRKLADEIGRDVAAVCWAATREWAEEEQQTTLAHEESDWPKSVWKVNEDDDDEEADKERIWASPLVVDPRLGHRMRRFEVRPEDELRASAVVVPEEDVEGWIKGSLRGLCRWAARSFEGKPRGPNVGFIDDE